MREPSLYRKVETCLLDIVQDRVAKTFPEPGRAGRAGVGMAKIVFGKAGKHRSENREAFGCRIDPDGAVRGGREFVPKGGLQQVAREQLAHPFQRIHGVGNGLAGASVHQIGMHENTGLTKGRRHTCGLVDGNALFHLFKQTVRGCFKPGGQRDAAGCGQEPRQIGREGFLEADVPHQEMVWPVSSRRSANAFNAAGGAASSTK